MRGGRTHFDGIRHEIKNGGVLDVEIDTRETIFEGESAMIVCSTDVTDRTRCSASSSTRHFTMRSRPAERSLFGDRLEHAHQRLARGTGCYAVLMLDLDNFKTVNDGLGHAAGDALLLEVSRRLSAGIRAGDTAARLGGDEFAILLEDLADPAAASRAAEASANSCAPRSPSPDDSSRSAQPSAWPRSSGGGQPPTSSATRMRRCMR